MGWASHVGRAAVQASSEGTSESRARCRGGVSSPRDRSEMFERIFGHGVLAQYAALFSQFFLEVFVALCDIALTHLQLFFVLHKVLVDSISPTTPLGGVSTRLFQNVLADSETVADFSVKLALQSVNPCVFVLTNFFDVLLKLLKSCIFCLPQTLNLVDNFLISCIIDVSEVVNLFANINGLLLANALLLFEPGLQIGDLL
mmetsp:Transcript_71988/g.127662  ORF Transcript_71988/g.127662 Transcript_71988/m.127662 type:complete len:201 (+) Transcript_71988:100-702(+)